MKRLAVRWLWRRACGLFTLALIAPLGFTPAHAASTGADGYVWEAIVWDLSPSDWLGDWEEGKKVIPLWKAQGDSPEAACRQRAKNWNTLIDLFGGDPKVRSVGIRPEIGYYYDLNNRRWYKDIEYSCLEKPSVFDEYDVWATARRVDRCANGYARNGSGACEPVKPPVQSCPISHPVIPGTGVKILSERDDSGSEELSLTRAYRSHVQYGLGAGIGQWLFAWQREIDAHAANLSGTAPITVLGGDGSVRTFHKEGNKWVSTGISDTAERLVEERLVQDEWGDWDYRDVVTWRYTVGATGSVEIYDANGKLQSVQASGRRPTTLTYNKAGQLILVTAPSGRALKFGYDPQGNVASVTAPDGAVTKYTYTANGMLSIVTRPDNATRQYVYEDPRFPTALTGVIDEAGMRYATYAYDDQGRAIISELTGGAERYQFQYGSDGQTTVLTPDSGSTVYGFLRQNGVLLPTGVSAPCPLCGKTSFRSEYDANGNVTRKVGYDGAVTAFLYDGNGREIQRVVGAGTTAAKTTNIEWHTTLRLPMRIASPGRIDSLTYDSAGRVATYAWFYTDDKNGATGFVAAPAEPATKLSWSYNSDGQVISVIETKGANETGRWSFAYDAEGNLRTVTNAAGKTGQAIAYDGAGRLLEAVDANGERIRYQYNSRGQQVLYEKGSQQTWYDYNALGLLTAVRGPGNFYMGYEYDAAHRLIAILRPANAVDTSFDEGSVMSPFSLDGSRTSTTEANTPSLWTRIWSWLLDWLGKWIGEAHAQVAMSRIDVRALPAPGYGAGAPVIGGDPASVLDPTIGQRRDPSQVLRAQLGNALNSLWESLQGAGRVIASVCGMGDDANPDTGQRPSKTPNTGTPGSKHTNPGSGQERWYGDDGLPSKDIDHDHDHGQGVPHVHDWYRDANGNPVRGPGRSYDPKIDG